MGKKSPNKGIGWIELIYGDYWAKKKKLIVAGLLIPLIFSFFLLLELNCISSAVSDLPYNPIIFFGMIIDNIGVPALVVIFLISVAFFLLFSLHLTSYFRVFETPLKTIHQEIYTQKKSPRYEILVKNFVISTFHYMEKIIYISLYSLGSLIVLIPSLVVGYLFYTYLDLFSMPEIANFISLIPAVGDALKGMVTFILESVVTKISPILQGIPLIYHIIVFFIPMLFLVPLSDLLEATVQKRQRGNIRSILKNGLLFVIKSLNFPRKTANFIYTTFLCLFTDQRTVSLDIPVVNSRNIELAMQNVLGVDQDCYIAKLPLFAQQILSEIERFPASIKNEIEQAYRDIIKKKIFSKKMMEALMERKDLMAKFQKQQEYVGKNTNVIFGVNEKGVMAYAIVNLPPPAYMTRIILRLWCTDPTVKGMIVDELRKLEFP
jgi:hypothetical protein